MPTKPHRPSSLCGPGPQLLLVFLAGAALGASNEPSLDLNTSFVQTDGGTSFVVFDVVTSPPSISCVASFAVWDRFGAGLQIGPFDTCEIDRNNELHLGGGLWGTELVLRGIDENGDGQADYVEAKARLGEPVPPGYGSRFVRYPGFLTHYLAREAVDPS